MEKDRRTIRLEKVRACKLIWDSKRNFLIDRVSEYTDKSEGETYWDITLSDKVSQLEIDALRVLHGISE